MIITQVRLYTEFLLTLNMTLIWYLENIRLLREKEDSKIKFECREGPSSFTALCIKLLSKHQKFLALVIDPIISEKFLTCQGVDMSTLDMSTVDMSRTLFFFSKKKSS